MDKTYCFPLKQSIGAKAVPCVVEGDLITRGQLLLFQEENTLGANIFSSISGKVNRVTDEAVYIDADEHQTKDFIRLKSENPLDLIREAGIVGLGGAGFPTYAKLNRSFPDGKGTVIINAAECEPVLNHNITRIEQNPEPVIRGLIIAMQITGALRGVIAIKRYHRKAIASLQRAIEASFLKDRISIHELEDMYPMGEERAIVREVLGILLPVTSLPMEADAVIINAETSVRIAEAVDLKKPFIDKDMTVAGKLKGDFSDKDMTVAGKLKGDFSDKDMTVAGKLKGDFSDKDMTVAGKLKGNFSDKLVQVFLDIPLGCSVGDMIEKAGGAGSDTGELIMGGPFTGHRTQATAPVIKTTGGIIASECFPKGPDRIGLLVCACGANTDRMKELAASYGSEIAGIEYCKQAKQVKGNLKCENPGHCPGQVAKILALKKKGAQAVLISNCTDCTNTVMSCAPALGLPVYHCTDGCLRAVNHKLIRKIIKI